MIWWLAEFSVVLLKRPTQSLAYHLILQGFSQKT